MADGGKPPPPPAAPPPGLPPPTPGPPGEPVFLLSKLLKKFARTPSLVAPAIKKKKKRIKNVLKAFNFSVNYYSNDTQKMNHTQMFHIQANFNLLRLGNFSNQSYIKQNMSKC